jgi:hypothetical protein
MESRYDKMSNKILSKYNNTTIIIIMINIVFIVCYIELLIDYFMVRMFAGIIYTLFVIQKILK